MEIRVHIDKADPKRQMAFGFANVFRRTDQSEVEDSQGHVISTEKAIAVIEDAVYSYVLESRSGDEQHVNYGVARLVESIVLTAEKREAFAIHAAKSELPPDVPDDELADLAALKLAAANEVLPDAWWVGFKIDDVGVWAKVEDGTYSMFSIVGRGKETPRAA
jgi:hypothetical protein